MHNEVIRARLTNRVTTTQLRALGELSETILEP
jgi:hypothetical protein